MGNMKNCREPRNKTFTALRIAVLLVALLVLPAGAQQDQPEGIPCPAEPTDMIISYGQTVLCEIEVVGDSDVFRFHGVAGERVGVRATRRSGGTPAIQLFDPQGVVRASADFYSTVWISYRLEMTGTFVIRVSDYRNDETMAYTLVLLRLGPAGANAEPVTAGQHYAGRIDPVGDLDQYYFDAVAGDTFYITATRLEYGTPALDVMDPSGNLIAGADFYSSVSVTVPIAVTGRYSVVVSDYRCDEILRFRLDIQCVGQCPSISLPSVRWVLTGCTSCRPGDTFSARLQINNGGSPARQAELKLGFYFPDGTPVNIADPHLELPPNFTFDGEIVRGTITPSHPQGTWRICARLLELNLGQGLAEACREFSIVP